jgi:hypothetical protein
VTVSFGLVALAITTGVVGFGVVWEIFSLWPVLIIAIGLDLLGKALHLSWVRALGSIAIIVALAYAVAVSAGNIEGIRLMPTGTGQRAEISEPVGSVAEARLDLEAGVGNISLESGEDLVVAEGVSPWGEPNFSVERTGDTAEVRLELGGDGGTVWPGRTDAWLDAQLSDSVVWDMVMDSGVSTLDADLSDVNVRSLELKQGVADCTLRLGDVPQGIDESSAVVDAGISSVAVRLPEGAEARFQSESGLTGHNVRGDFESQGGGVWETPGFDQARASGEGVWLITVKSGIGSIDVDTY